MKHGSITRLQRQIGSHLSGQQRVETVKGNKKCKSQLVRFWPQYFGILTVFYPSITLRKEEPSIANIIWRYLCVWREKFKKATTNEKKESALSPRQCTVSQVDHNKGKIAQIALWIASPSTLLSGSGSQRLLPVCRPKKNAPGIEIWLQWRSYCRNCSVFWGQR